MVRLRNPRGGATVGYPDTTAVTIGDTGRATRLRLLESAPVIDEARGKALITVTRQGSAAGEARASYRTIAGGTYGGVTATQGDIVWPDGDTNGKTVTVLLNPATLAAGQSGTFQMEIFSAINASLEASDGTAVSVLPLSVTVNDTATPPPPAPPVQPPSSGGGGGAMSSLWLAVLASLLAVQLFPVMRGWSKGHSELIDSVG